MTSRCYEELQAKLENQQQPVLLSRESTDCAPKQNIIYYNSSSLPEDYQLPIITDWTSFDNALHNIDDLNENARKNAEDILASDEAAAAIAASDLAQNQIEYHTIVASDNGVILTENFVVSSDYVISSDAYNAKVIYEESLSISFQKKIKVITSNAQLYLLSFLVNNVIKNGETISIYIPNDILIGRIYKNVRGEFIEANFSDYYPFTIEKVLRYKIDEKVKSNKNNYLFSQKTKAEKWSSISKNVRIRKSKIFLSADKCSYAVPTKK